VLVQILSGINTPLIKQAVTQMSPFVFGFLRSSISLAVLLPFYLLVKKYGWLKKRKKLARRDLHLAALGTFIVYGVANLGFFIGIKQTTSINASIIFLLWPIVFFLANVEVLKERFTKRVFAGIGIAFLGAVTAVGWPLMGNLGSVGSPGIGALLIFGTIFVDVIGTLILKQALRRVDPLTVVIMGLTIATVFYGILALPNIAEIQLMADPLVRNAVLYGSIMVGCVAYTLGYYALHLTKGGDYSVVSYLQPIVGIIAATILLNEGFTPSLLFGTAGVFAGLYLVEAKHLGHPHGHGVRH